MADVSNDIHSIGKVTTRGFCFHVSGTHDSIMFHKDSPHGSVPLFFAQRGLLVRAKPTIPCVRRVMADGGDARHSVFAPSQHGNKSQNWVRSEPMKGQNSWQGIWNARVRPQSDPGTDQARWADPSHRLKMKAYIFASATVVFTKHGGTVNGISSPTRTLGASGNNVMRHRIRFLR